jgi:hypothetical protein
MGERIIEKYRYTLKSMNSGSDKYGPCEICKKHADTVYYQKESRFYKGGGWTYSGCNSYFGHKDCLLSVRKS